MNKSTNELMNAVKKKRVFLKENALFYMGVV